jgi:non-ribosomal peptide synthetase component F
MSEVATAYEHGPAALPALKVQYLDFARWQREHVTEAVLRRQLDWWAGVLHGMPLGPTLPFDHVPDVPTRRIAGLAVDIGPATRAGLEDVARATGSTVFTVAVAAVSALFGGHAGTTDVVFSTTLSGRTRAELEELVGTFSGVGRLRTDLAGDPPFVVLVTRALDRVLDMFEHQDIPFLRVRRALLPQFPTGGLGVAAALPTEFQYFHTTGHRELFFRGQLHPLSLTLLDDGDRLGGSWSWKLDYYDAATVERLAGDLQRVLEVVAADPSVRLSDLPISR